MPASINANIEDLRIAWRRYQRDLRDRCFVDHPFIETWIQVDVDSWLLTIQTELTAGYNPRISHRCAVPKAGFMIRPGTVLEPEDALVYTYLVGRIYGAIRKATGGLEGKVDIAYQTVEDESAVDWTRHNFKIWQQWRENSLQALSTRVQYVVVTDISGFYDSIPIQRLVQDLRGFGAAEEVLTVLQECLRKWAYGREQGIPQGYWASDLLAKLYMSPVDRRLQRDEFEHLRYVDDIRIFCESKLEAKKAIQFLSQLLYPRGLSLQSGKTEILSNSEARSAFDGVNETIKELNMELAEEIAESAEAAPYVTPGEILAALADRDDPPVQTLERAFTEHFGAGSDEKFDATLFHYLLVRLGKAGSRVAINYCLQMLATGPQETAYMLRYFTDVTLTADERQMLVHYMQSDDAIYDYQLYQIIRWFYKDDIEDDDVLQLVRKWVADRNRSFWLRSYALTYLGRFGDDADLEGIEQGYGEVASDIERADRIAALSRMEKSRRNGFYARVLRDGHYVERAVQIVKST